MDLRSESDRTGRWAKRCRKKYRHGIEVFKQTDAARGSLGKGEIIELTFEPLG